MVIEELKFKRERVIWICPSVQLHENEAEVHSELQLLGFAVWDAKCCQLLQSVLSRVELKCQRIFKTGLYPCEITGAGILSNGKKQGHAIQNLKRRLVLKLTSGTLSTEWHLCTFEQPCFKWWSCLNLPFMQSGWYISQTEEVLELSEFLCKFNLTWKVQDGLLVSCLKYPGLSG